MGGFVRRCVSMKLHYCAHLENFGDALNPWLWRQLLPGCLDDDGRELFLGIGTVLSDQIPAAPVKVVCGAGAGYGPPPRLDARWHVYFVRGPLTARALNLRPRTAVTDPALLAAGFPVPRGKRYVASFMPHHLSARYADWKSVCAAAGLHYIDPAGSVETVLAEIAGSGLVVTEALHGAVAADAFRVPWVAVRGYPQILDFKWRDWCASLGMTYRPESLVPLWDVSRYGSPLTPLRLAAKEALRHVGLSSRRWSPPRPLRSPPRDFEVAAHALRRLAEGNREMLSRDAMMDSALARLKDALVQVRRDCSARARAESREPLSGIAAAPGSLSR